jgi:hypothetical protein
MRTCSCALLCKFLILGNISDEVIDIILALLSLSLHRVLYISTTDGATPANI